MSVRKTSLKIRLFLFGYKIIKIFPKLATLCYKFFNLILKAYEGVWLGLLKRESIHEINETFYNAQKFYFTDAHNKSGLFLWEKYVIEKYFKDKKTLLLLAAGGGREINSLETLGFEIHGFECNQELIKYANAFLSRERLISRVAFSEPDHCPMIGNKLDGAILSWGTYSHIKSSSKRISLLKEIKENLRPHAPLLISFWVYSGDNLNSKVVARVANLFKPYETIEIGDALPTQFTHSFDKEQIERELSASGYELVYYGTEAYGHAVGLVKA